MGVTYNTALTIKKMAQLLAPGIAAEPLATALANANSLYRLHQPALVSFCPVHTPTLGRDCSFTVGCKPSVDAIRYKFAHQVLPRWTGNITVRVDSGRGDGPTTWMTIYGPTAVAVTTDTWLDHRHHGVIGADEDRLRVIYTGVGGNVLISHVLAYPDPDPAAVPIVAPYGQQPSGFWPADDALLATTGPVHTELLDRCLRNSVAVLRDRYQALGSFVQEDALSGNALRWIAPFGTEAVGSWALMGKARGVLPYQSGEPMGGNDLRPQLRVDVLAEVTAGTTVDRVRVVARGIGQLAGKQAEVLCNATGAMVVNTTGLRAELDGTAGAGVDLEFYVRAEAGQQVKLHSAMVSWRPGS